VGNPATCASPPYDQYDDALVARLKAQSPYNVCRLVAAPAGGGPDQSGEHYRKAQSLFGTWVAQGVIMPDNGPAVYPYSQTYTSGGRRLTRHGFIAVGDVRDAGIFTHEETHSHVQEDRAQLRLATAADFGLIFMIYSDPSQQIDRVMRECEDGEPLVVAEQPDGSVHRLYRCGDPQRVQRILKSMESRECVIADGHHRTAAARDTWQRRQKDNWAGVMMAFFNADAPGMTVLPIHRLVTSVPGRDFDSLIEGIAELFDVALIPMPDVPYDERASFLAGLVAERARHDRISFAMVGQPSEIAFLLEAGKAQMAKWPWPPDLPEESRQLPTSVFETGILHAALGFSVEDIDSGKRLDFPKDVGTVVESVRSGRAQLGFLLPPTPLDAIFSVARLKRNLPQKSTFFFPKLLTGLVVHRIEDGQND
jgi:uncharacterized protein (DUF1015 family)